MKLRSGPLFIVLSVVAALLAVIAGLIVVGSPDEARMRRFDEKRVSDLASISRAIATYRLTHETLPASLEALRSAQPSSTFYLKDPLGRSYEYTAKDAFNYELCAAFYGSMESKPNNWASIFATHGAGRQCFDAEARPRAQR